MQLLLRHKLLIVGVTLVAAASAGGAYAATQSSTNPRQAYLNDVAKRLHVSPSKLRAALKGAMIDRLNALVKAGKLTQAQANKIEQRIGKRGRAPLFFGPGPGGPPGFPRFAPGPHGPRPFLHIALKGPIHSAASYLGLSDTQLLNDLGKGQSLAQIAKKQNKSVSGLEQTLDSAAKTALDKAVSAGLITKAAEQKILSRLPARIDRLVTRTGFRHMERLKPGPVPPMPPRPGGPAGVGPAAAPSPAA